jgi:hypothetical protein
LHHPQRHVVIPSEQPETRTRSIQIYTTHPPGAAQSTLMVDNGLDVGVLGPLQMSVDGAPVPLGTPKQRAVLAMLVMSRTRPVSSDSLVNARLQSGLCRHRGAGDACR